MPAVLSRDAPAGLWPAAVGQGRGEPLSWEICRLPCSVAEIFSHLSDWPQLTSTGTPPPSPDDAPETNGAAAIGGEGFGAGIGTIAAALALHLPGREGLTELGGDLAEQVVETGLAVFGALQSLTDSPDASEASFARMRSTLAQQRQPSSLLCVLLPGYLNSSVLTRFTVAECAAFSLLLLGGSTGLLPSVCSLDALGGSWGPAIASSSIWRLVAPIFLHASAPHLGANIVFQVRVGFNIERDLGALRFVLLYLLSGVGGNLVSTVDPWKLSGAAGSSVLPHWDEYLAERGGWLLGITSLTTVMLLTLHSASHGHLGGSVTGACLMLLLSSESTSEVKPELRRAAQAILPLLLGTASLRLSLMPAMRITLACSPKDRGLAGADLSISISIPVMR